MLKIIEEEQKVIEEVKLLVFIGFTSSVVYFFQAWFMPVLENSNKTSTCRSATAL